MSVITVKFDTAYFEEFLGNEKAKLVPEEVVRDAESNLERYLTNHSQEFWDAVNSSIEKAIDDNRQKLVEAGAVDAEDDDGGDDDDF